MNSDLVTYLIHKQRSQRLMGDSYTMHPCEVNARYLRNFHAELGLDQVHDLLYAAGNTEEEISNALRRIANEEKARERGESPKPPRLPKPKKVKGAADAEREA